MTTLYKNRPYAVLGLGKSGLATARYLLQEGAEVYVWDDNEAVLRALAPHERLRPAPPEDWPWDRLDGVVAGPGVPLTHPAPHPAFASAKKHGTPLYCDIDLLVRRYPEASYIGVTGTNGKSTTTALIAHVLKECGMRALAVGNIGVPVLDVTAERPGETVFVIECSSFQLDLCAEFAPHVAVWTNLAPDHLDRHGSTEGYVAAKRRIFLRQGPNDFAVIGADDAVSRRIAAELGTQRNGPQVVRISSADASGSDVYCGEDGLTDAALGLTLPLPSCPAASGAHMRQNAAAAYAACKPYGISPERFLAALASFAPLPHRMEPVKQAGNVRFVNDSKATNVASAERALSAFRDCYWIAGGKAKGDDLAPLMAHRAHIVKAYLVGAAEGEFAALLDAYAVPYARCGTLENAVAAACADVAARRDSGVKTVLLSPACASYDQWNNFEERGRAFARYAEEECRKGMFFES
jgi:UDP-N-acetylmuramoylalanine--D-glutamate ligase